MSTELATQSSASPAILGSSILAQRLAMDPDAMIDTLKAQCFKCKPGDVTDQQMAAFISIANVMEVNPLLPGMLYAFPVQGGGIVPMMGPDGVFKKLAEHKEVDSWETEVFPPDVLVPPTHAVTRIYRKGRDKPLTFTALLSEWKVGANPNWNTRPRHMLGLRSLKQCARQIIHGIPFDEDERKIMDEVNVTNSVRDEAAEPIDPKTRPKVERSRKGAAAALETVTPPADPAQTARQQEIAKASAGAVDAVLEEKKTAPETKPEIKAETKVEPPKESKTVTELNSAPLKELKDKQTVTVICEVVEMIAKNFGTAEKPNPVVKAKVKGEYEGDVFDQAAKMTAAGGVTYSPAWQIEKPVKITLVGRLRASGTVGAVVTAIEVVENELP